MAEDIIFKWHEDDQDRSVLMAGPFIIGHYQNQFLPQPTCLLPGAMVDDDCYTQLEAKARVEAAVERWFAEVMPNG